jgi:hypothetical protein
MKMPEKCFEQILEDMISLQNQGFPISDPYAAATKLWREYLKNEEQLPDFSRK